MGISVSSYNYSVPRKRKARAADESKLPLFTTILKIALLFLIFFGAAVMKVMWNSQAETLNKDVISLENKIADIERETDNLSVLIEQQSGKNILAQVKKYNLDLHYPYPGQIRKLEFVSSVKKVETAVKQPANKKPIMVSQGGVTKNPDSPAKYYR